jgi:hypothetical protein
MNDQNNPSQHGNDNDNNNGNDLLHRNSDRSTLQHNDKPAVHPFQLPLPNPTANQMRSDMSDDEVCHNEDDDDDDDDDDGDDAKSCHSNASDASDTIMDTTTNPNNKDRPNPTPDGFLKRPTRRHSINLLSKAYLAKEPKKLPPVKASTARKLKTPPTIGKTVANSGKKTR